MHNDSELKGGYIDYGRQHRDFDEDGCEYTSRASPAGHKFGIRSHFPGPEIGRPDLNWRDQGNCVISSWNNGHVWPEMVLQTPAMLDSLGLLPWSSFSFVMTSSRIRN